MDLRAAISQHAAQHDRGAPWGKSLLRATALRSRRRGLDKTRLGTLGGLVLRWEGQSTPGIGVVDLGVEQMFSDLFGRRGFEPSHQVLECQVEW